MNILKCFGLGNQDKEKQIVRDFFKNEVCRDAFIPFCSHEILFKLRVTSSFLKAMVDNHISVILGPTINLELRNIKRNFLLSEKYEITKIIDGKNTIRKYFLIKNISILFQNLFPICKEILSEESTNPFRNTEIILANSCFESLLRVEDLKNEKINGISNKLDKIVHFLSNLISNKLFEGNICHDKMTNLEINKDTQYTYFLPQKGDKRYLREEDSKKLQKLFENNTLFSILLFNKNYAAFPFPDLYSVSWHFPKNRFPKIDNLQNLKILKLKRKSLEIFPKDFCSEHLTTLLITTDNFSQEIFNCEKTKINFPKLRFLTIYTSEAIKRIFKKNIFYRQQIYYIHTENSKKFFLREIEKRQNNELPFDDYFNSFPNLETLIQKINNNNKDTIIEFFKKNQRIPKAKENVLQEFILF